MQEKPEHLVEMVKEFLSYKKVEYVELSAINVKQSNIVIGYMINEKHPTIAGRTLMKEKWVEYNLSFMFSFLFQKAARIVASGTTEEKSDFREQIQKSVDELERLIKNKNTEELMQIRGVNERIDEVEAKIGLLMKEKFAPSPVILNDPNDIPR